METILNGIFTSDPANFLVLVLFALFGANLNVLISYMNRNKSGRKVPKPFNPKFFLRDNWLRMAISFGMMYAVLRFGQDTIIAYIPNVFDETAKEPGSDASLRLAFAIGWSVDILPHIFRRFLRFGDTIKDE